jgi:hypothetical protein
MAYRSEAAQRRARAEGAGWHRARSLAVCAALVLACAAACNKTPDCFDIHPGDRIAITVVEIYQKNPYTTTFPCGFGFDLTQGLMLVSTDLGNPDSHGEGATCNSAAVRIDPFAGWTWTPADMSAGFGHILTGSFNATNGTCAGYVSIVANLMSNGQPFAASEAGQSPNVLMQRTFTAQGDGGAGCPHTCNDYYSVNLARL